MKLVDYEVISNERIAKDTYRIKLYGDNSENKRPGQFVNIAIDGFYLRRPLSVCRIDNNSVSKLLNPKKGLTL